ncbi:MAG TPA: hypothetical protein DDY73_07280 [Coprobacter fastidiosus]|uniref:Uncharacterized protein n=1 Tax=Coprobacter fastidiosus TaxID=1099853 RepID=A0A316R6N6_9BACT|nr:MAG: hypothetical protein DBY02_03455 [Coprobacter fastidiosus]RHO61479.1 hypothetical protein DW107_02700 [Tannerella sp. AM09-19]HBJ08794.1 hypothetical protein [Coprobacter fastidiosus]
MGIERFLKYCVKKTVFLRKKYKNKKKARLRADYLTFILKKILFSVFDCQKFNYICLDNLMSYMMSETVCSYFFA